MARIIDGREIAKEGRKRIKNEVEVFFGKYQHLPKLAVVIVGNDPASLFYIRMMTKTCEKVSIKFEQHKLAPDSSEAELLELINKLNLDDSVSGIIVQMPLPKYIDQEKVQKAVHPLKDVDCFNPINMGKLALANPEFYPCTPYAVYEILKKENIICEGKHTVIVGRSNIVGKPLALILLQKEKYANATITICHSRTKNLAEFTRQADILIAAVGRAEMIHEDMVKEGAVIIDVGTNEVEGHLTGDVAFNEVQGKVSAITPVPGGVGPITNVMLMENTLTAARKLTMNE